LPFRALKSLGGLLVLLICLLPQKTVGQDYFKEPINWPERSKISRGEFYALASGNDTLTAMVNMFYRKRELGKTSFIVTGASTASMVIVLPIVLLSSWGNSSNNVDKTLNTVLAIYGITFYSTIGFGTYNLSKYTRKKLMTSMMIYHEKGETSNMIRNNLRNKDFPANYKRLKR
jgi:hypothetical protein